MLSSIDRAKAETQFSKSIDLVKDAIPDGLKGAGTQPAQAVRVVLTELVSNIVRITPEKHEVDDVVKKLISLD